MSKTRLNLIPLSLLLGAFLFGTVRCGVKGPPEPPLPSEASTKKKQEDPQNRKKSP